MTSTSSWTPCPFCFRPLDTNQGSCPHCGRRTSTQVGAETDDADAQTTVHSQPSGFHDAVDRFEIGAEVGRGTFGVVYRARDRQTGATVAVKMLSLLWQARPEDRRRLLRMYEREVQALAAVSHPGIVRLLDSGDKDGVPYLVMEFVEGKTLGARILEGPLPVEESVRVLREVANALFAAHRAGVLHRDLKPSNVLLGKDGAVKLTDFGLAKMETELATSMTPTGGALGTPHYMSPEQALGKDATVRSDLYALGVIGYELLTGRRPFEGSVPTIMYRVVHEAPQRPSSINGALPPSVDAFLMRALERNPLLRFPSAEEMARGVVEQLGPAALPATTLVPIVGPRSRRGVEIDTPPALPPTMDVSRGAIVRRRRALPSGERLLVAAGIILIGVLAIFAATISRNVVGVPVVGPGATPGTGLVVRGAPAGANVFVDGRATGVLPAALPLPAAGRHLITIVHPEQATYRELIEVAPEATSVVVTARPSSAAPVPAVEELALLGVVSAGRAPLALLGGPQGERAWVRVGMDAADGFVASVDGDGITVRVLLSTPPDTAYELRVHAVPEAQGSGRIKVMTEPPSAQVRLVAGGPVVGLTPCTVDLEGVGSLSMSLARTRGPTVVVDGITVERLRTMGEIVVLLPD